MVADTQTAYGFHVDLPKTSRTMLTDIMPFLDKVSREYYGKTVQKKMALLSNDFKTYGSHWATYMIPFLKEYNIGKFTAEKNT